MFQDTMCLSRVAYKESVLNTNVSRKTIRTRPVKQQERELSPAITASFMNQELLYKILQFNW